MAINIASLVGSNAMAGSALGVQPYPILSLRWDVAARNPQGFIGLADRFKGNQETDMVNSHRYPDVINGFHYIAHGTVSINPRDGEFTFADSSVKPKSGALYLNQKKSQMSSTAGTTILGSTTIKTLTGLILNPIKELVPSTILTPQKGWIAEFFPVMVKFNVVDWIVISAVQTLLLQSLGVLFSDKGDKTKVHRETKDLGTLIIDNQDFEQRILNEEVPVT